MKWGTQVSAFQQEFDAKPDKERDPMERVKSDQPISIVAVMIVVMLIAAGGLMRPDLTAAADESIIDTIIAGVEARYNVAGFTADFDQESVLKAMAVTDTASGRVMVRQPGKMRWEYLVPDPQTIITDGDDLWVYRPEENQVLVGKAPALFGEGKGAGFLSNIKMVRQSFQVTLVPESGPDRYRLKLVPNRSTVDIMAVMLDIDRQTFDLSEITTVNVYGDETRIQLKNIRFDAPPESLFRFEVPEGADILQMNP